MSSIVLLNESCVDQNVDAIVNAANKNLAPGGGVCGEIFKRANIVDLMIACSYIKRPLPDGSAVITPACQIKNARFIIHAVGPNFSVTPAAFKELFEAYYNSLCVLKEYLLHSISFPLISSGIYGGDLENPVAESVKQCVLAYKKFISDYPDYQIDVKVCAYSPESMKEAKPVFDSMI
jgi:O-acetyl-ADP-ribose deacetylase (regulator of RNase III)